MCGRAWWASVRPQAGSYVLLDEFGRGSNECFRQSPDFGRGKRNVFISIQDQQIKTISKMTNAPILYYVHDPMCSWCWAFRPMWQTIKAGLPESVHIRNLLGGLAPDSDIPMAASMRTHLQATWRRIQDQVPDTEFNFAFWQNCQPRRSTYPACRAVIAARRQGAPREEAMIHSIQKAYYLEARNPSDTQTLIALAGEMGLDRMRFGQDLGSAETAHTLHEEIDHARRIGGRSFPSLFLDLDGGVRPVSIDYLRPEKVLEQIQTLIATQRADI